MKISKETFVKAINRMMSFEDAIIDLYNMGINVVEFSSHHDIVDAFVSTLDEITNSEEWIAYYCFELDFGRKHGDESVSVNGEYVDISTPEKLYNFLDSREEQKNE